MGHIRLGRLPKTRSWDTVVSLLGGGVADAPELADATLKAALGLRPILEREPGLVQAFHFLAQLCYAARGDDFYDRCRKLGIDLSSETSRTVPLAFLTSAANALDKSVRSVRGRTLFSDIAQQAFREALTQAINQQPVSLFGQSEAELRSSFRELTEAWDAVPPETESEDRFRVARWNADQSISRLSPNIKRQVRAHFETQKWEPLKARAPKA